jgi:hypothetical protein
LGKLFVLLVAGQREAVSEIDLTRE